MSILKAIYDARDEFYQKRGTKPRCIHLCAHTAHQIKKELYPHANIDLAELPLRILNGMKVCQRSDADDSGWELEMDSHE